MGDQFGQWKPLDGSQKSELRTGIGEISTSDVHTSKCQVHCALKQVREEAVAGSETSLHKHLWTIALPMELTLQHRSPFWAGFLRNPQVSSCDHQRQSSCVASALGLSYSELVQRLKTTKHDRCKLHICTRVRWENTICLCCVVLQGFDFQMQNHSAATGFSFRKFSLYTNTCTALFTHREDPKDNFYLSMKKQQSCKLTPAEGSVRPG